MGDETRKPPNWVEVSSGIEAQSLQEVTEDILVECLNRETGELQYYQGHKYEDAQGWILSDYALFPSEIPSYVDSNEMFLIIPDQAEQMIKGVPQDSLVNRWGICQISK